MKIELKRHSRRKAVLLNLLLLAAAGTAVAVWTLPFSNWNSLKARSPDTVIARCTKTPTTVEFRGKIVPLDGPHGLRNSDIDIMWVLRGRTNLGPARLSSFYRPRQDEKYLIFSTYTGDGAYDATETYRIVALGTDFPTNILAGRSFDEQIRAVLQYRVDMLKREMEEAQEEKNRLEEGLKQ